MVSLYRIYFLVAPVSYLRVIALMVFLSNACLYKFKLDGTGVLSVEFNKIFLLLFVTALGTVPHRNYLHP